MKLEKKTIYILGTNFIFLVSIGVIALLFLLIGKPFIQGFYCDDFSIAKPYGSNTVKIATLFVAALLVAIACFIFGVWTSKRTLREEEWETLDTNRRWKKMLIDVSLLTIIFIYGSGLNMFATDVGKYSIGRLRPHFLTVCQPNWSLMNCTDKYGHRKYIVGDQYCQTTDLKALKEARLSFPSGHSSFSGYAAVFLILYLETQIRYEKHEILPKFFLQVLIAAAAIYVGLSRVTDYFHHPTDVIGGFAVGIVIAIAMHLSLVRYYYPRHTKDSSTKVEASTILQIETAVNEE